MTTSRERLIQYRQASITSDLAKAMRKLEARASKVGNIRITFSSYAKPSMSWDSVRESPGATGCKPEWSMMPSGREVTLGIKLLDDDGDELSRAERELATLWGLAIPLGFTPWDRYPLPGPTAGLMHFLGPWQILYDHLLSLGRGEEAWPSVASAAQVDVGMWEGPKALERLIQAQLHRIGINVGPIDGMMGSITTEGLKRTGLVNLPLQEIAEKLVKMQPPKPKDPDQQRIGHVVLPDPNFSIVCSGQVSSTKSATGAALTIKGPGRIVVDIS